jgi:hypothetical protein
MRPRARAPAPWWCAVQPRWNRHSASGRTHPAVTACRVLSAASRAGHHHRHHALLRPRPHPLSDTRARGPRRASHASPTASTPHAASWVSVLRATWRQAPWSWTMCEWWRWLELQHLPACDARLGPARGGWRLCTLCGERAAARQARPCAQPPDPVMLSGPVMPGLEAWQAGHGGDAAAALPARAGACWWMMRMQTPLVTTPCACAQGFPWMQVWMCISDHRLLLRSDQRAP